MIPIVDTLLSLKVMKLAWMLERIGIMTSKVFKSNGAIRKINSWNVNQTPAKLKH